jgi:type IV pilus assembly protein PilM
MIFKRSHSNVAVDIGSGVVKIVEADHSRANARIVNMGVTSLLPGAIVDGEVMDHQLVVNTVRALYQGLGIKNKRVSTSISGRDVIVKKITMDRMKEAEAREVIRWEAEQHVPFDIESVNLDFQILDPDADGLEMSVLLVAAKRELVENRTALLQDAGLEPTRIDVDAFAVQRAFEANYAPEDGGVFGLVNVGHETTNVNLVHGHDPILTRDLPVGANRYLEFLQKNLGLSHEDAELVLQGRSLAHVSDEVVKDQLAQVSQEISAGVDRARAFLTTSGGTADNQLSTLFLSGGCASIPGLADQLGQALNVPVETLDPFRRVPYEPNLFTHETRRELGPLLTLAVGLALQN